MPAGTPALPGQAAASRRCHPRAPQYARHVASRSLPDYERDGQHFYERAANEPALEELHPVFEILSRKFTLARRALNTLTDGYLKTLRAPYLNAPSG